MLRAFWDEFEDQHTENEECIPAGDDLILGVTEVEEALEAAGLSD